MVVVSEMNGQFWGLTLDGLKRYTQTVEKAFHISMAALEPVKGGSDAKIKGEPVSVMIQHKSTNFVLCTLQQGVLFQVPLDLNFADGEELTLFLNGKGVVHLTGYLLEQDLPPSEFGDSDSELEMTDANVLSDTIKKGPKRKKKQIENVSKKAKLEENDDEDDTDEDDSDEDFIDDEAEEASEDDEEDEDEELEVPDKKETSQSPDDNKQTTFEMSKKEKKKAARIAAKAAMKATKQKLTQDMSNASTHETSTEPKKFKQKRTTNIDANKKSDNLVNEPIKLAKKRVLEGGLTLEDLKEGHGAEAKLGKMVHVYYVGRLLNGKLFDSKTSGTGFKFRLGKKEVISGWDLGLAGMKVGGKRKITIPPKLGYGRQKTEGIPPNSTLVFDVELKAVS